MSSGVDWQAMWLTVRLATTVALILLLGGLPVAYWLAFSKARWKSLVETIVALPLVLPPTVLGFYGLIAMGSRSPIGRWYENWSGHTLVFSFQGLVIASVLYSLPFAVQPFAAAFSQIDTRLLDAAALLGSTRIRTFFRIVAPLALGGVIRGVVLSFAHTVGEFGVVLMVGGNIPGATRTISLDVYDKVQDLNYAGANHTALILLAFSFTVLLGIYSGPRNLWRGWISH